MVTQVWPLTKAVSTASPFVAVTAYETVASSPTSSVNEVGSAVFDSSQVKGKFANAMADQYGQPAELTTERWLELQKKYSA